MLTDGRRTTDDGRKVMTIAHLGELKISEIPGKPLNQNKAVSAQENRRSIVLKQNLTTTGKPKDPR